MSYRGTSWVHPSGFIVEMEKVRPQNGETTEYRVVHEDGSVLGRVYRTHRAGRFWVARRPDGTWIEDREIAGATRPFRSRADAVDHLMDEVELVP